MMVNYYTYREDYSFCIILAERDGVDVARAVVGKSLNLPWPFFGMFECEEDKELFLLMDQKIIETARLFGSDEIRGPIDFSGVHSWAFTSYRNNGDWWFPDKWQKEYYHPMFTDMGWETAEHLTSFILSEATHTNLMEDITGKEKRMHDAGVRAFHFTEIPMEKWLNDMPELVINTFNIRDHAFVKEDTFFMELYLGNITSIITNPESGMLYYKGDELVALEICYQNFIDLICNPDGKKTPPDKSVRDRLPYWGSLFTAVKNEYRDSVAAYVWARMAWYPKNVLGSYACGRRINSRYGWSKRMIADGSEIMQAYTFLKKSLR